MNPLPMRPPHHFHCARRAIGLIVLLAASAAWSQATGGLLSGSVITPSGQNAAHAKVTAKNLATGQSFTVVSNLLGVYQFPAVPPGWYQVIAEAAGLRTPTVKIQLVTGVRSTLNLALSGQAKAPAPHNPAPGLSLQSLGFKPNQIRGSLSEQARLNKRTRMLQIHQKLGLLTTIPLIATVIAGGWAKPHRYRLSNGQFAPLPTGSTSGRNIHLALGVVTTGMYFTTAYYAIFAPKIQGQKKKGPILWHEGLAWIHGTGMILTPILGAMAYQQLNRGERVHGIAKLHGAVAVTTLGAYVAALLVVARPHWLAEITRAPHRVFAWLHAGMQPAPPRVQTTLFTP